jgi:thiol-disulfide isomerase/thioredoxin
LPISQFLRILEIKQREVFMFDDHPQITRAPEFAPGYWINTEQPLTLAALRGKVLLVNIWDYSCVNSLRMLSYIKEWHSRYEEQGLRVVGVHTPQFAFGRERAQIEQAVAELNIRYPVVTDNESRTWNAYRNRFYPALYLIDHRGNIRYQHYGAGNYTEIERALQSLLLERDAAVELPAVLPPLRMEDDPDMPYRRPTRELRGGLHRGSLGNPEGYAPNIPILYRLPDDRATGAFYVAGAWVAAEQYLSYQGHTGGIIQIPYEAAEVYAVFSPNADTVERTLNPQTVSVEIWQDGQPIVTDRRGFDLTEDGRVLINRPRMYNLIRNPKLEQHELTLRVQSRGFALYGFAFVGSSR